MGCGHRRAIRGGVAAGHGRTNRHPWRAEVGFVRATGNFARPLAAEIGDLIPVIGGPDGQNIAVIRGAADGARAVAKIAGREYRYNPRGPPGGDHPGVGVVAALKEVPRIADDVGAAVRVPICRAARQGIGGQHPLSREQTGAGGCAAGGRDPLCAGRYADGAVRAVGACQGSHCMGSVKICTRGCVYFRQKGVEPAIGVVVATVAQIAPVVVKQRGVQIIHARIDIRHHHPFTRHAEVAPDGVRADAGHAPFHSRLPADADSAQGCLRCRQRAVYFQVGHLPLTGQEVKGGDAGSDEKAVDNCQGVESFRIAGALLAGEEFVDRGLGAGGHRAQCADDKAPAGAPIGDGVGWVQVCLFLEQDNITAFALAGDLLAQSRIKGGRAAFLGLGQAKEQGNPRAEENDSVKEKGRVQAGMG